MKVLRDFPSAHFQQTPFSPNSKTVRLLNLDWSASLGVRFWCPGQLSCPPSFVGCSGGIWAWGLWSWFPFFWICFPVWVLVSILPWYVSSICPCYDLRPYWSPGVSWPLLVCTVLLGSGWVLMWNFGSHVWQPPHWKEKAPELAAALKEAALSPVSTSVGLSLADISQSVAALEQILLEESVLLLRSAYVLDRLEVELRPIQVFLSNVV